MTRRRTPQLDAVWEVLCGSDDHPTAGEVLRRVRRRLPRVSQATVYRNLEKLHALGRLRVVRADGAAIRYDSTTAAHDHFVCDRCNSMTDLHPPLTEVDLSALERSGFVVRTRSTAVYGLCRSCAGSVEGQLDLVGEGKHSRPSPAESADANA